MLLATARLLRDLGTDVEVVGPRCAGRHPDLAAADGYPVHRLAADRRRYLHDLRAWHGGRRELLWCHGLVPALATAGRSRRVVHLHKLPTRAQHAAHLAARSRSSVTLVPSRWMATRVPGARVLPMLDPGPGVCRATAGASTPPGLPGSPLGRQGPGRPGPGPSPARRAVRRAPRARRRTAFRRRGGGARGRRVRGPRGDRRAEWGGWAREPPARRRRPRRARRSSEAFGLSAAEAMSAGVPCIVSDAGALPEVVGAEHPWVGPHPPPPREAPPPPPPPPPTGRQTRTRPSPSTPRRRRPPRTWPHGRAQRSEWQAARPRPPQDGSVSFSSSA